MNNDLIKEQILKEMRDLANDPHYQNEVIPARMFRDHAEKYCGIKILTLEDNSKNDPPDFFITTENQRINLEVTKLGDEVVCMRNSFFKAVESIAEPIISKHFHLLPNGLYFFNFFPGSLLETNVNGLKIDVSDFSFKASIRDIEEQLEIKISTAFAKFADEIIIEDKKGNKVGELRIFKIESPEKTYQFQKQGLSRYEPWSANGFLAEIRLSVGKKDKKYRKNKSAEFKANPWWLLISDIDDEMGSTNLGFDISILKAESVFFEKIFFIQNILKDYRITELKHSM